MADPRNLIIVGASARAAAFSALRAGLRPWCADLFADADLRARCLVTAVPLERFPLSAAQLLRQAPPGPFLYTGGLENRSRLVAAIARRHTLWGNTPDVLRAVRDPLRLVHVFREFDVQCPEIPVDAGELLPDRRWLVKPRDGAGGAGIHFWRPGQAGPRRRFYIQEYLEGPSYSAVYAGFEHGVQLLGVSRQLVGEAWLHAKIGRASCRERV